MIKLYFDKLYSTLRANEPCSIAIPFAQGILTDTTKIGVFQGSCDMDTLSKPDYTNLSPIPIQVKITATHKDGSIKYILIRFLTTLQPNQKECLYCFINEELADVYSCLNNANQTTSVDASDPILTCTPTSSGFSVHTGVLEFQVIHNSNALFDFVKTDKKTYSANCFHGPFLTDATQQCYHAHFRKWRIVEAGEVCTILSCDAILLPQGIESSDTQEGLLCEARITAYAGKDWMDVAFRLINATDDVLEIASYTFDVTNPVLEENIASCRTCVASSNYKTDYFISEVGETVTKSINAQSLINQSNEHFGEVFYGTFFADTTAADGGICACVYQAYQNFPKAVEASGNKVTTFLVPENDINIIMQSGMAREQRMMLYFHSADTSLQDINNRTTIYQMPDRPYIDASVYEESGVMPDIFVHAKNFDAECAFIQCADAHGRSYGMMNWGDTPDANYTAQGRGHGRPVWTNNEYDFPHACMLLYARTGIRRFLDYALVTGNHQIDVDVCHYSKDPLIIGGQWEHTHGHCVEGVMVCSHQWVEGILDCYHMTGDDRYLETALGIGENILRLLDTPMYQKEGSFNARETGWALRSLTALYVETYDTKWTVKSDWIVNQFHEWADTYGGWLAPYIDNVVIRVPFMISVAVGSLIRYYREFPRADIYTLIIQAVDDLIENCLMDNGLFFYKELPSLNRLGNNPLVLESLAVAYELTGDRKYLEAGMKTYHHVLHNMASAGGGGKRIVEDAVLVGNTGTKQFAQTFIPVATFYKALEKAGLSF